MPARVHDSLRAHHHPETMPLRWPGDHTVHAGLGDPHSAAFSAWDEPVARTRTVSICESARFAGGLRARGGESAALFGLTRPRECGDEYVRGTQILLGEALRPIGQGA